MVLQFEYEYVFGSHVYIFKSGDKLRYEIVLENTNGRFYDLSLIQLQFSDRIYFDPNLCESIYQCLNDFWKIRPNTTIMFKVSALAERNVVKIRKFSSWIAKKSEWIDFIGVKKIVALDDIICVFEIKQK